MRFNPRASINSARVRSGGGSSSGGLGGLGGMLGGSSGSGSGGGFSIPRLGGGGIVGIIIAVVVFFIASKVGGGSGGLGDVLSGSAFNAGGSTGLSGQAFDYTTCTTGEDANNSEECALVAVENSLTNYWTSQPDVASVFHPEAAITVFTGSVSTGGCGSATTDVGPFYCPVDETIYIDYGFYDTIYQQLGGEATAFVKAYIIGHEYGHHIQNLLGTMNQVKTQQGADSDSVRLELQADCYAGMWAAHATTVPDTDGQVLIEDLTDQDIQEAIGAAKTVGDDYIQETMSGNPNPESFTHGSSAQRMAWFKSGLNGGDRISACDTFSSTNLDNPPA